ncbi:MAG: NADH-quinone oxidoreductase subunit NuoB [Spirochaetales bacterium]|uniref:NADH-quinone oxidoreductase subunit NuoB n=1 Tax=Candidatus Thalassospirochaeta sargassi TaxID=3119039 RepID=A0AAJ1ICN8_9SPIO|nr:NADH-quinone oxidoreductase subunit NuoB [Spirochaetales bacterium]
MIKTIKARVHQKYRTTSFPKAIPELPERYRGLPQINSADCNSYCTACVDVCPVSAIAKTNGKISLDLGRCIFCGKCAEACMTECLSFSKDYRLAARSREALFIQENISFDQAGKLKSEFLRLFGRSLKLRQVSAGGCNACEADVNVLSTVGWDLGRFGIKFVASPRHADGLLVTGPVTENMREALLKTYEAVPSPKIVIAAGSCALSGGLFRGHEQTAEGVDQLIPVDLYIPGCPPHPLTILDGMLRLLGKIKTPYR